MTIHFFPLLRVPPQVEELKIQTTWRVILHHLPMTPKRKRPLPLLATVSFFIFSFFFTIEFSTNYPFQTYDPSNLSSLRFQMSIRPLLLQTQLLQL